METPTQLLHRLTSYEPGREWDEPIDDPRVLQDLVVNDMDRRTFYYKNFDASLPRIELPRELPDTSLSVLQVLSGEHAEPADLDLAHLSRLLHLSAGVVRTGERAYGTYLFRAAGSAGGRFPLELYASIPYGTDLPAGVHWYDPEAHALVQVGPPPEGGTPAIVVTGVPWRTGWRYRERGFRHIFWDAGTMLSQLLALADSSGLAPRLHSRFPDKAAAQLVGADGVHEWPVAVVALGDGPPALQATGTAVEGAVDAAPVEFPLVTAAQRAGDADVLGAPWDFGAPVEASSEVAGTVEDVVLARGSLRRMDPTKALPLTFLTESMRAAMRGISVPHFVVVHDVEGFEPGIYRWPNLGEPIRTGPLRDELYRVSLEQGLARDAAFVVIAAADVGSLDDREYREAQLAAGLVEGKLHLMAYAIGAGASGMTFMDSEIHALLGEPLDALLFTCVGVPEYKASPGGLPGAPRAIKTPEPRL